MTAKHRHEQVQVIGAEAPPPPRPGASFPWMAAPILVGILAAVASGLLREPVPSALAPRPTATPADVITLDAGAAHLDDLVPGFTGALVIVSTSHVGDSYVSRWSPGSGPPAQTVALDGLLSIEIDASGSMLAGLELPDTDGAETLLSVTDTRGGSKALAADPGSFAWHASTAGSIAWLDDTQAGDADVVARDAAGSTRVVGRIGSGSLAAWGEWGYAFVLPSAAAATDLRDPDLEPVARIAGLPIGQMPDGRILFSNGHGYPGAGRSGPVTFLVDPATGGIEPMPAVEENEVVLRMSPSPSGDRVALHVVPPSGIREDPFLAGSIRIVSVDGGLIGEVATNRSVEPMAWSSDGRYLVFPLSDRRGNTQLAFRDTRRGETIIVRSPHFDTRPHFPVVLTVLNET